MMPDQQLEGNFYEYMHELGQIDKDWNRKVLEFYAPHFAECGRVLDVGCGQGQFIELLASEDVEGMGVDVDARMVDTCREKGLDVVEADLFEYLPRHKERFDGVFSSNLIEHLSAEDASRFVHLAFESLAPGGVVLIATPNPESLIVHLHEFWRDATHVRLYNCSLLEFLLSWAGFEDIQARGNPRTAWVPSPTFQAVPQLLNDLSSWRKSGRWDFTLSDVSASMAEERRQSFWWRLAFTLRRRLARFLADTVMFEEFAGLNNALSQMNRALDEKFAALMTASAASQRIDRALYRNQNRMLTAPREVFAKGIKPLPRREETE